jgi:hypothetical protein
LQEEIAHLNAAFNMPHLTEFAALRALSSGTPALMNAWYSPISMMGC